MQTPVPNAFATGRSPKHAVVAVTDSLMRLLAPRELEAVVAHEISHVRNRDVLTLTIASFIAMIAALVMNNFLFAAMFNRRDSGNAWIIAGIVAVVVYFVAQLLIMALSRYREFAADRGSAYITGSPKDLISAPREDQWEDGGSTAPAEAGGRDGERVLHHPCPVRIHPARTLLHASASRKEDCCS